MVHLSTDLFQTLVLALLVVTLLVLLMILTVLGRIRSALTEGAAGTATTEPETEASPASDISPAPDETIAAASEPSVAEQVATTSIANEPATSGIAETSEVSSGGYGGPYTSDVAAGSAAATTSEPAGRDAAATGSETEEQVADPQEQPFERGGRWYFRRGDELLVYDEGAAQWVQAEPSEDAQPSSTFASTWETSAEPGDIGASGAGASTSVTGSVTSSSEDVVSETTGETTQWGTSASEPAQQTTEPDTGAHLDNETDVAAGTQEDHSEIGQPAPAPADFWRCPSCGAINGSTAPTCRMCFTPRP